jgi:hypothetical protein
MLIFFLLFNASNISTSSNVPGEAAQDQDSSTPEALFHILDKVPLLKHLRI